MVFFSRLRVYFISIALFVWLKLLFVSIREIQWNGTNQTTEWKFNEFRYNYSAAITIWLVVFLLSFSIHCCVGFAMDFGHWMMWCVQNDVEDNNKIPSNLVLSQQKFVFVYKSSRFTHMQIITIENHCVYHCAIYSYQS